MARRFDGEDLGAAGPDDHDAIAVVVGLERADVGDQLIGEVLLVLPRLDVGTIETLHVLTIEHGGHGLDRGEFVLHLVEQLVLEHARMLGRFVAVVSEGPSVRLPSRMVPISASEPIGFARPLRIAKTPAMVVVLTAPRPTSRMPSLPLAGAISTGVDTTKNYIIIG